WLQDVALYKQGTGPYWARRYEIGTNAPSDTVNLSALPAQTLAHYATWLAKHEHTSIRAYERTKYDAVVDPADARAFHTIQAALDVAPTNGAKPFVIYIHN